MIIYFFCENQYLHYNSQFFAKPIFSINFLWKPNNAPPFFSLTIRLTVHIWSIKIIYYSCFSMPIYNSSCFLITVMIQHYEFMFIFYFFNILYSRAFEFWLMIQYTLYLKFHFSFSVQYQLITFIANAQSVYLH